MAERLVNDSRSPTGKTFVDETFIDTIDWDAAEAPLPDHAEGSAFIAGYYIGMLKGHLIQDRAHDNLERTHTFSISAMHLERIEMTAAKYGYRMIVLDPGKMKRKLARVTFTREEPTFKERLEAKRCPHCGSLAVADQVTVSGGVGASVIGPPVKHCQACDKVWSFERPLPSTPPPTTLQADY